MVFDGPAAELPVARLMPNAPYARRRAIAADLDRWLAARWDWVRARTVPLLAAFLGLLVTLGAVKYVVVYAYSDNLALEVRTRLTPTRPAPHKAVQPCAAFAGRRAIDPVQIVVEPVRHGDPYVELTFTPPESR